LLEHVCSRPRAPIKLLCPNPLLTLPPSERKNRHLKPTFMCFFQAWLRAHTLDSLHSLSMLSALTPTAGRGVRVVLGRQSFQEIVLLVGVLQRSYSRATKVRSGWVEHPLRMDELRLEGRHDAGREYTKSCQRC
ncbi:unnamed protein product, partial [Ectocarpus fasciculatus]